MKKRSTYRIWLFILLPFCLLWGMKELRLHKKIPFLSNLDTTPLFLTHIKIHDYLDGILPSFPLSLVPHPIKNPYKNVTESLFIEKISTLPAWAKEKLTQDLNVFEKFSAEDVKDTFALYDQSDVPVLYTMKDGHVTCTFKSESTICSGTVYAIRFYKRVFEGFVKRGLINNLTIMMRFSDSSHTDFSHLKISDLAPFFGVTKDSTKPIDQETILIPDWQNLLSIKNTRKRLDQANAASPWKDKKSIIFWRGGPADVTGYRHKIVSMSHKDASKIDARFTYGAPDGQNASHVEPADHVPYKYQLSIDGHTAAWERPVWQLYSNCVLVKQSSPLVQWYYHALIPGVHFIDVPNDPEKLLESVQGYSDDTCKKIAEEGHAFAKNNLSLEDMLAYIAVALQMLEEKQKSA